MDSEQLQRRIKEHFSDAQCRVVDLTGTADHYELHVATEAFRGLSPLAAHRLIYQAVGSDVGRAIHALSVKTYLPENWVR